MSAVPQLKSSREVMCLNRLQELTHQVYSILDFLVQESLLDKQTLEVVKRSPNLAKSVQELLNSLRESGKLQMLEYEWTLLPEENIRIYIVTDRNHVEFSYNS